MNTNGKNIVDQLAVMLSLQDKTKEELEAIIQRYPYFALARVLFNKKIKDEQNSTETQMQKTVLYFNNPLWFEYLTSDSQTHLANSSNEIESPIGQYIEESSQPNNAAEATNNLKKI